MLHVQYMCLHVIVSHLLTVSFYGSVLRTEGPFVLGAYNSAFKKKIVLISLLIMFSIHYFWTALLIIYGSIDQKNLNTKQ